MRYTIGTTNCYICGWLAVAGIPKEVTWFNLKSRSFSRLRRWDQWRNILVSEMIGEVTCMHGCYLQAHMENFVRQMINDFNELFGRYPKTSATSGLPITCLTKNLGETIMHSECRSIVGKILYFVRTISPVCANSCRKLSQHLENPGTVLWKAVERWLGYLFANMSRRVFKICAPIEMRIYDVIDSAFANNPDTRKSTNAYLGTIGKQLG